MCKNFVKNFYTSYESGTVIDQGDTKMPKLKTKRGVAKRFKITKKKKVKYSAGGKSHLASSKKTRRIRNLRKRRTLAGKKENRFIRSMLPYS